MKRPLTPTEQRMVEMWNAGEKSLAIAAELDMAPSTVTSWRGRLGLEARHANPTRYTDDQLSEIQRRYEVTGESCTEIAAALGNGWNKNMVVGVVFRRKFKKPARPGIGPKAPRVRAVRPPKPPKPPKATPPQPFDLSKSKTDSTAEQRAEKAAAGRLIIKRTIDAANDNSVPMVGRSFGQCAWPVGTPARAADQLACGAPIYQGIEKCSYCLDHAQRAFARDITQPKPKENLERANRRWAA